MFSKTLLLSVLLTSTVLAQENGVLSSLDGGLAGTVRVVDSDTLEIADFTIQDASAPGLYWWGSESDNLSDGFRISNAQVTQEADGESLDVALDAGKTADDFTTVGLWCETFGINFGQTTISADASTSDAGSDDDSDATQTSAASPAQTSAESAASGIKVLLPTVFAGSLAFALGACLL